MLRVNIPKEDKNMMIHNVQAYFELERSETIGELAAEQFIDFMMNELGPYMYNQALTDARAMLHEKINQLDDELYILEKPVQQRRR